MKRLLVSIVLVAWASVASAQYPYNYYGGYAVPSVPQLPGTYMSGPGYMVGGGYGASVWVTPQWSVQSYNPYWGQMQAAQRAQGQATYQRYFGPQNQYRGYRGR